MGYVVSQLLVCSIIAGAPCTSSYFTINFYLQLSSGLSLFQLIFVLFVTSLSVKVIVLVRIDHNSNSLTSLKSLQCPQPPMIN